ncbi:hypothetical protein HDU67_005881, partial [Dinochytrium kinnereticum]
MQDLEDDEMSDNVDNSIPLSSRVVGYIGSVSDLDTPEKEKPTGLAPLVPPQTTSTLLQPLKHVLSVPILKVENEHGKSEVVMDDNAEDYVDEDFEFEEDGEDDDDFFNQPLSREVSSLDPAPATLPLDTKPSEITPSASQEPATTDSSTRTFPSMNLTLTSTLAPQKPVAALAPLSNLPPAKPILGSLPPLQSKLPGLGGLRMDASTRHLLIDEDDSEKNVEDHRLSNGTMKDEEGKEDQDFEAEESEEDNIPKTSSIAEPHSSPQTQPSTILERDAEDSCPEDEEDKGTNRI